MTKTTYSSEELYHYCSMESLYEILNSMALRLTNIRYMNDSKEYSWISELAKKVVWKLKHSTRTEQETKLCDMLLEHFDYLTMDETFFPEYFCVCFSTARDSLSQWRAYTNDGKGVAIGFSRKWLESHVNGHTTSLSKVEYLDESDAVLSGFKQQVEQGFSKIADSERALLHEELERIARQIEDSWDSRAPSCKNAAFIEEDEVRLVHMPNLIKHRIGPTEYCHRGDVIVPYIALKIEPRLKPISRIVLGPRNRVEHNRRAIMEFASSKDIQLGLDQFEVSSASYGELRRIEELRVPAGLQSRSRWSNM